MSQFDDFKDALAALSAPFPPDRVSVKVGAVNRDRTRARLVKYLQHTDVADRLEEVDPSWSNEIIKQDVHQEGGEVWVSTHMKLTLLGVTRENSGEGQDSKSSASDALKRCAMLFGVGRYLYDTVPVWVDYNEERDRYRKWVFEDYEEALGQVGESVPRPKATSAPAIVKPNGPAPRKAAGPVKSKSQWIAEIRKCAGALKLSDVDLRSWARECANVSPDKMDLPQLEKFTAELQTEMRKVGVRA